MPGKASSIIIFFLIISLYIFSYGTILKTDHRSAQDGEATWITHISPKVLSFIAGEFKGITASYITLDVGARIGTKVIRNTDARKDTNYQYRVAQKTINWNIIHKLLTLSQHLDPRFQQTYITAQGNLPWDTNLLMETNAILQIASDSRQWDWQPLNFIAFNAYFFLNNPGEAGKLMLQAANRTNAPSFLTILGARLAQEGNETKSAILLMKTMLINQPETEQEDIQLKNRLQALEGVLEIENSVAAYHSQYNTFPENITELIASGFLTVAPLNPYSFEYCIDQKGKIFFDKPNCRSLDIQ